MAGKKNEQKKGEVIRYIMSGKNVTQATSYFGYKSDESIYRILRMFKPEVVDYANEHTLAETLEHFAVYDLTEKWLNDNEIICYKITSEDILNEYRKGVSISEIAESYNLTETEIRTEIVAAHIPIREDEEDVDNGEGFITIEDNATDIGTNSIPATYPLRFGDVVWVRNAKNTFGDFSLGNSARPAIVLSNDTYLKSNLSLNAGITVVFGSAQIYKDSDFALILSEGYLGKAGEYQLNNIRTVRKQNIIFSKYGKQFPHLNKDDLERLKEKICNFFNIEKRKLLPDVEEVENLVIRLFNKGLNRVDIYDVLEQTAYFAPKALIQSVLDKNGYEGIKQIETKNEVSDVFTKPIGYDAEDENVEEITEVDIELIEAKAKLSVYESIFSKVSSISV